MKIAAIPDPHGTHHWEKIISRIDEFDKIVFLGDYVDNWHNKWPDQIDNFEKIIQFKKDNLEKVELLWGNHDTSYYLHEHCSGYQPHHAIDIYEIINNNKDLFKVIYLQNNYIFAHGGVSEIWMKHSGITKPEEINQLFLEHPNYFRFVGPNGYGDNINEGPLWIRPKSLSLTAIKGYNQIVGHTEPENCPEIIKSIYDNIITIIDNREHNYIHELIL
jgi:hypothetical protein